MNTNNKLPINEYLPEILASIDCNLVTQVTAATGSGKSISILKALAESGKRVFSSVPTRVSATSLSSYLKTLNPNLNIGYAAEGNVKYRDDTQVVYATSGHVKRKMLGYFSNRFFNRTGLSFTDVLVLDETHSGSLDNTVILSLWMEAHRRDVKIPKLLLLSATPTDLPIKPEPFVVNVPIPTPFPVKVIYDSPADDVYNHACEIAISLHRDERITGDFLIFVPGSSDADELVANLHDKITDAVILPAYSNLSSEELMQIYIPTDGIRKIIVATNIAESSITIDGLEVVIDTMNCKEATASPSGAIRLETVPITKDSAKQRLGRVGRTCPGICYRLISESAFDELKNHRQPEIERMPIHNVVMEFFHANIDPLTAICGINPHHVAESIELLIRLDMLQQRNNTYIVTDCGHFAPSVPLGVKNASFLWKWIKSGHPVYAGVVLASIIDTHSTGYFYIPRKKRNQSKIEYESFCNTYIQANFGHWVGDTTLHTYLNMWRDFTNSSGRNHFHLVSDPFSYNYRRWSRENSINYKQLSETLLIISQTYRITRSNFPRYNINVSVFDSNDSLSKALPFLEDIYQDNKITSGRFREMSHLKTRLRHDYDNRRLISAVERTRPSEVIALATHEIISSIGLPMGFIDICIRCTSTNNSNAN